VSKDKTSKEIKQSKT